METAPTCHEKVVLARISRHCAVVFYLVDDLKFAHVQVNPGLLRQLTRRAHHRESCLQRTLASCACRRVTRAVLQFSVSKNAPVPTIRPVSAHSNHALSLQRALSSKAERTKDENATSWRGKGHLNCGESTGCIECIRALGRDAVQVERQRDARAGNGDAFRQLQGDTGVSLSLGQCEWRSHRHNIHKSWH